MQRVYQVGGEPGQSQLQVGGYLQGWRRDQKSSRQSCSARVHEMRSLRFRCASSVPSTSSIVAPVRIGRLIARSDVKTRNPFVDYVLLRLLPKYFAAHQ